jgi:hypothetical protein
MQTRLKHSLRSAALLMLLLTVDTLDSARFSTCLAQGSLTPPGAPAPTMKTLDQIEPRTPISSFNYTISQPGSYYLTQNFIGLSGGIVIDSGNVTLDLNGFTLAAGDANAIYVVGSHPNITIRNGVIRDFPDDAIVAGGAQDAVLESLQVFNNSGVGIALGAGAQVYRCAVISNAYNGLAVGSGSQIRWCNISGTQGLGLSVGPDSTVQDCTLLQNAGRGLTAPERCRVMSCTVASNTDIGIFAGSGCQVRECVASRNQGNAGIFAGNDSVVQDCTVESNNADGIQVTSRCRVLSNTAVANGNAGIRVTPFNHDTRLEGNLVTGGAIGLLISDTGNFVAHNIVKNNADNYNIASGNQLNLWLCQIPESIDWPASVTLAGTLTGVGGSNGLTINASDVTVDLAGHALVGTSGSLSGIEINGSLTNVCVRNGTVRSWGGFGIDNSGISTHCQFTGLRAIANGNTGLVGGRSCVLENCIAVSNRIAGIWANDESALSDCTAQYNFTGGFSVGSDCLVSKCVAGYNPGGGFGCGSGNRITDCVAEANGSDGINTGDGCQVEACQASQNGGDGISTGIRCLVKDCHAVHDLNYGISVESDCVVSGCQASQCGSVSTTAGIRTVSLSSGSRIENNSVRDNTGWGILANSGDIVVRNSAGGNSAGNYSPSSGANFGPVQPPNTATSPWANFQF